MSLKAPLAAMTEKLFKNQKLFGSRAASVLEAKRMKRALRRLFAFYFNLCRVPKNILLPLSDFREWIIKVKAALKLSRASLEGLLNMKGIIGNDSFDVNNSDFKHSSDSDHKMKSSAATTFVNIPPDSTRFLATNCAPLEFISIICFSPSTFVIFHNIKYENGQSTFTSPSKYSRLKAFKQTNKQVICNNDENETKVD